VEPFAGLVLRAGVIGLVTFSILERVDLLRALAPSPALSRLLVVTLAQIHALRLLATESREGLRSRMVRKPGVLDVVRGAGAVTGALVTLSARNAREISDAMRSRGF
jgi:cobalt/nickel transport system permease protein